MRDYIEEAGAGRYAYGSPIGDLTVAVGGGGAVTGIVFGRSEAPPLARDHPGLASAFDRYFSDGQELSGVPVSLRVSDFMALALEGIRSIPRGQVRSYAEVARLIGRPGAARAVGRACASNPVPLIIPCHRVLGSAGPGGYQNGLDSKFYLLRQEGFKDPVPQVIPPQREVRRLRGRAPVAYQTTGSEAPART